ncbi:helix-turn-helix transcriptional regulator [Burkholderia lata]|uniref:Transcriptional regulator n=1 Tax=Burkholderia lata (strain ATCC 17760 / DSM 23089 / LMG 22485 / NCIMB 9086 / R18194 / 383) TaxID=482957 RepID=A0A6P2X1T6_BURL3|nr:WYL domain-containing protein [Burkholderia lata]VWD02646.1 transcriptional regulator [Burkholderia lata]
MLAPEHETVLNAMAPSLGRWWTSSELKEIVLGRFPEFHERKARRTLIALEQMRWIERDGIGPATRWRLVKQVPASMKRPSVDLALALLKLQQLAQHHLPQRMGEFEAYFDSAAGVLAESSADSRLLGARAWMGKTVRLNAGYPLIAPEVSPGIFDAVLTALYRDETLAIRYCKADQQSGSVREYIALPYAIVEKGPCWYLVVRGRRSSGRQGDAFLIRCDRIIEVRNLGHDLKREDDFDLETFIRDDRVLEWFPEPPVLLELYVHEWKGVPSQFRSVRLAADQRLEDRADGFVLWATVVPSVALRHLLLQHAPSVEVISPPELREEIAESLDVALRRYRAPVTPAAQRGD